MNALVVRASRFYDGRMANPPLITAIIPHFLQTPQLTRCLAALEASTVPIQPWVHDNNDNNIGFTRAINRGLKAALASGTTYTLLLNQDCYVAPNAVENLLDFMETNSACGLAGLKQLDAHNPDLIVHAGCTDAYPAGKHFHGRKSNGDHTVNRKMPWVNGAAIFARMEAVQEFGLMDQNMLLVGSDSDWCYTARSRGWEVWYCAEAEATHEGGITTRPALPEIEAIYTSDMNWWRDKWVGTALFKKLSAPEAHNPQRFP